MFLLPKRAKLWPFRCRASLQSRQMEPLLWQLILVGMVWLWAYDNLRRSNLRGLVKIWCLMLEKMPILKWAYFPEISADSCKISSPVVKWWQQRTCGNPCQIRDCRTFASPQGDVRVRQPLGHKVCSVSCVCTIEILMSLFCKKSQHYLQNKLIVNRMWFQYLAKANRGHEHSSMLAVSNE